MFGIKKKLVLENLNAAFSQNRELIFRRVHIYNHPPKI